VSAGWRSSTCLLRWTRRIGSEYSLKFGLKSMEEYFALDGHMATFTSLGGMG
jgi:hypothetical protein